MTKQILVIEDETIMLSLLSTFLEKAGYRAIGATNAAEALATLESGAPDLVLLDLGLPDEDGIVLLRKIRTVSNVPVVVLSARSDNEIRMAALELGANDFVTKGVDPQELLLRMHNVLGGEAGAHDNHAPVTFAGWSFDPEGRELRDPAGKNVHLTPAETQILAALAHHPGSAVKRQSLVDAVSGIENGPTERNLDTYINRLRKKIEPDPHNPELIVTLKGVGYRLKRD